MYLRAGCSSSLDAGLLFKPVYNRNELGMLGLKRDTVSIPVTCAYGLYGPSPAFGLLQIVNFVFRSYNRTAHQDRPFLSFLYVCVVIIVPKIPHIAQAASSIT